MIYVAPDPGIHNAYAPDLSDRHNNMKGTSVDAYCVLSFGGKSKHLQMSLMYCLQRTGGRNNRYKDKICVF